MSISEKNKLRGKAEIIEQIATHYSIIGDTLKAFKNYYKAKRIALTEKDTASLKNIYQNLFRLHTVNKVDSSYIYMKRNLSWTNWSTRLLGLLAVIIIILFITH
ncbi:hypothetical protein H9X57_17220 [Flavobacterium piscinae]|uniref:hypothetical protein n=1 Tax=Flavobacterium piscinae TaxID=2506424 RepID=UPI0019C5AD3A|nr:hypothetical protein [Flavobacterium piscinae]MBC8884484.1 hypothetical protein [Flavobacterium piscinae]